MKCANWRFVITNSLLRDMSVSAFFWREKSLQEMTPQEWESLCDGCGKCCLVKLQDDETDEVFYTNVSCRYLSLKECRCTHYDNRTDLVEACVKLTPDKVEEFFWLPSTCAYRLLAEKKDLPHWHPLVSGSASSVNEAGQSVKGKVFSEKIIPVEDLEDYIIRWVE
jgi:uncharacterized cysteine cluster protein YcgN (CxxCxxCC family)